MCDNSTEQDIQRFTEQGGKVNRRQFNQLLATDKPDSPHHTIVESDALALHAIAENDNERSPQMQPMLKKAYQAAGLTAHIEVYPDTLHGWTPPDSRVYNEKQAERAWQQTLALFKQAL